jgi:dipeptidyl aminopeptidase/acylaminoacyl peptidase
VKRLETPRVLGELVTWSPEGRRLAFIGLPAGETHPDPRGDVFVVGADGTDLRNLTGTTQRETNPVWSPAGDAIAFIADANMTSRLTVIPLADGVARPAITGPVTGTFAWAPDGTSIVFVESTSTPPTVEGALGFSTSTLRTVDGRLQQSPSTPLAVIDGTVVCPLSWQRLAP